MPVVAENGINYSFAKNPKRSDSNFRDNSLLWVVNLETKQAKLYPNLKKGVDYFKSISADVTLRICGYYKDSGKVYKNYLFLSHDVFIKVYPDASKSGIDTIILLRHLSGNGLEVSSPENLKIFFSLITVFRCCRCRKIKSVIDSN